jgi:hypothetical protein
MLDMPCVRFLVLPVQPEIDEPFWAEDFAPVRRDSMGAV